MEKPRNKQTTVYEDSGRGPSDAPPPVIYEGGGGSARFDLDRGLVDIVMKGTAAEAGSSKRQTGGGPVVEPDSGLGWLSVEYLDGGGRESPSFAWSAAPWPRFAGAVHRRRRLAAFRGTEKPVEGKTEGLVVSVGFYRLPEDYLGMRIGLENRTSRVLHRFAVEPLNGLRLPPDWHLSVPTCGGWAVAAADYPDDFRVSLRYPVKGSLQWLELFGGEAGLAFGTLDSAPWIKDFTVHRSGDAFRLGVTHPYLDLVAGGSLVLPPVYIGLHRGGWQRGAEWYRRWLDTVVSRRKAPRWLLDNPLWAWVSIKKQYAPAPDTPYRDLPARSGELGELDLPLIQVAAWFEHGHDTRYPDFVAGESQGGEGELVDAVRTIHSAGRYMALYTNGRIVDPRSATLARHPEWTEWLVRAPRGRRYRDFQGSEVTGIEIDVPQQDWDTDDACAKERYGEVVFGVMCPSVRMWQRLFSRRLGALARTYGIDGIYIDQILGAMALPCYAVNHGHGTPKEAWGGYHRLMGLVRRRVKAARPQAYLATEGISDILSRYFDIVQSHNDWRGEAPETAFPMPELLRHTLPTVLQACGPIYDGNEYLLRLAHAAGSGLDIACRATDPSSAFAMRLKTVASWRRRFGAEYLPGEPVACQAADFPRHRATAIRRGDRIFLFTADLAVNDAPEPMEIHIPEAPGEKLRPVLWEDEHTPRGREERLPDSVSVASAEGGGFTVVLPAHETGFLIAELS